MAQNTTTNTASITLVPGRMTSRATAVRACINEVCSYARTNDPEDLEDAIKRLRRNLTRFETEARLTCMKED